MSLLLGSAPEGKGPPHCGWCRIEGVPFKPNPVYDRLCESCAADIEAFNLSREELLTGLGEVVGVWVEKWAADLTFTLDPEELVAQLLESELFEKTAVETLARSGIHIEQRSGQWFLKDGAA